LKFLARAFLPVVNDTQIVKDVLNQARPEVAFGVMPRIELDLYDAPIEQLIALPRFLLRGLLPRLTRQIRHLFLKHPHEEGLSAAPFAEEANRQRRLQG